MVIAPISSPASAAVSPPHFNQPSTVVTNSAPGALPSAGGLGTAPSAPVAGAIAADVAIAAASTAFFARPPMRRDNERVAYLMAPCAASA